MTTECHFERLEDRRLLSGLLGINLEFPQGPYDATGVVSYDATTQSFDSDATPLAFRFGPTEARPILAPRDFQLHLQVDNAGNLVGGVTGDDLVVEGQIDRYGDGTIDFDGVLLTGEIVDFGWLDSGSTTDQYDFRFTPTGGDLVTAGFFDGMDIGVTMISANSTFEGDWSVDFGGNSQGVFGAIESEGGVVLVPGSIAGRVYLDANNNGMDDGEEGIEEVVVTLTGTDANGNAVSLTTMTDECGNYIFEDVMPGTYTLTETQPDDLLDNFETAGDAGGLVGNDVISEITLANDQDATGYNFGELEPSSISGLVWVDFNDDGEMDFDEPIIEGAELTLTGVDDLGNVVNLTTVTDAEGDYVFTDLRPGTYTVTETQPEGFIDGQDMVGTEGGTLANDEISAISIGIAVNAMDYNFGERPEGSTEVCSGQTAPVSFWKSCKGKRLIKNLNGGCSSTQLGNWLAVTFPNIYGAGSDNDLTGATNYEVYRTFKETFIARKCGRWWRRRRRYRRRATLDSQVMALAFATYVTNQSLAGNIGECYGFTVTEFGVGATLWNVGDAGEAFGVPDNTELTVMDMLLATDAQTVDGELYGGDNYLQFLANAVYKTLNEAGRTGLCGEALINWFNNRLEQILCGCQC